MRERRNAFDFWACQKATNAQGGKTASFFERLVDNFGPVDVAFGKTDQIPEGVFYVDKSNGYNWLKLPFADNQFNFGRARNIYIARHNIPLLDMSRFVPIVSLKNRNTTAEMCALDRQTKRSQLCSPDEEANAQLEKGNFRLFLKSAPENVEGTNPELFILMIFRRGSSYQTSLLLSDSVCKLEIGMKNTKGECRSEEATN